MRTDLTITPARSVAPPGAVASSPAGGGAAAPVARTAVAAAPPPGPTPQQRAEALAQAIDAANRALAGNGRELTFEFDKEIGRTVYRIVDTQTRQVVRQIPTEEALAIAQSLAAGRSVGALMTARI